MESTSAEYLNVFHDMFDKCTLGLLMKAEFAMNKTDLQSRHPNGRRCRGEVVSDVIEEGPRGEGGGGGGEDVNGERHKETQDKGEGDMGLGDEAVVEKRKCPVSDTGGTVKKKRSGSGLVGSVPVVTHRKCHHNRRVSRCRD